MIMAVRLGATVCIGGGLPLMGSAAIPMRLRLQVSSFGYEIYDVHMPYPISLLKEGVKREKILRIMVFGG